MNQREGRMDDPMCPQEDLPGEEIHALIPGKLFTELLGRIYVIHAPIGERWVVAPKGTKRTFLKKSRSEAVECLQSYHGIKP